MSTTTLDEDFDIDNTPSAKFELLKVGTYPAEILTAEVVATKSGTGTAVKLVWSITQGEYERRQVFQTILIEHDSPKAQEIGRGMFKDICSSCGLTGTIRDLETLLFKECAIKVGIESDKNGQYDDKNRITRVFPVGAMATPAQARAAQVAKAAKVASASEIQPSFKADDPNMNDKVPF
jgi:hypothetical protein